MEDSFPPLAVPVWAAQQTQAPVVNSLHPKGDAESHRQAPNWGRTRGFACRFHVKIAMVIQ